MDIKQKNSAALEKHYSICWRNVSYRLADGKPILNGLSGSVEPGQILAILGPTGCGKTTLMDLISCRLSPSLITGEFGVDYQRVAPDSSEWSHRVGYIEQTCAAFTDFTVRKSLLFVGTLRLSNSMTNEQIVDRVEYIISELGLSKCADTIIGDTEERGISGGERKRLFVGMAFISRYQVVYLDEPTTGLDATTSLELMRLVTGFVKREQITLVLTIHQPRYEIVEFFSAVYIMTDGRLVYYGSVEAGVSYFQSLGYSGYNEKTNPTDFFLDIVTFNERVIDFEEEKRRLVGLADLWSGHEAQKKKDVLPFRDPEPGFLKESPYNSSRLREIVEISKRYAVLNFREHTQLGQIIAVLIAPLFTFMISRLMGKNGVPGFSSFFAASIYMTIQVVTAFMTQAGPIALTVIMEKPKLRRERWASLYRISSLIVGKLVGSFLIKFPAFMIMIMLILVATQCSELFELTYILEIISFSFFIVLSSLSLGLCVGPLVKTAEFLGLVILVASLGFLGATGFGIWASGLVNFKFLVFDLPGTLPHYTLYVYLTLATIVFLFIGSLGLRRATQHIGQ